MSIGDAEETQLPIAPKVEERHDDQLSKEPSRQQTLWISNSNLGTVQSTQENRSVQTTYCIKINVQV